MKKQPEISSNFFNRLDHMLIFKSNLPIRKDKMTLFYDMSRQATIEKLNFLTTPEKFSPLILESSQNRKVRDVKNYLKQY